MPTLCTNSYCLNKIRKILFGKYFFCIHVFTHFLVSCFYNEKYRLLNYSEPGELSGIHRMTPVRGDSCGDRTTEEHSLAIRKRIDICLYVRSVTTKALGTFRTSRLQAGTPISFYFMYGQIDVITAQRGLKTREKNYDVSNIVLRAT